LAKFFADCFIARQPFKKAFIAITSSRLCAQTASCFFSCGPCLWAPKLERYRFLFFGTGLDGSSWACRALSLSCRGWMGFYVQSRFGFYEFLDVGPILPGSVAAGLLFFLLLLRAKRSDNLRSCYGL